jgi:hypothetical protein
MAIFYVCVCCCLDPLICPACKSENNDDDATVAPQVGFIRPFGTTVGSVNHINAQAHLLPKAGVRNERRLEAVRCSAMLSLATRPCCFDPRAALAVLDGADAF